MRLEAAAPFLDRWFLFAFADNRPLPFNYWWRHGCRLQYMPPLRAMMMICRRTHEFLCRSLPARRATHATKMGDDTGLFEDMLDTLVLALIIRASGRRGPLWYCGRGRHCSICLTCFDIALLRWIRAIAALAINSLPFISAVTQSSRRHFRGTAISG